MSKLTDIAGTATPGPAVHFRKTCYGGNGMRSFLRDVIAMANASHSGPRHIVVGVEVDQKGGRKIREVPDGDFSLKPPYESQVSEFIEPDIQLSYQPVLLDGKRVGVFEIGACPERPYMMRTDYSETLRRGDAYVRIQQTVVKMGRPQLQALFEKTFQESVTADRIEIGFAGEVLHKELNLPTIDFAGLPSAVARANIKQLLDAAQNAKDTGATTTLTRLLHARLFGSDIPYEQRSPEELMAEMAELGEKHRDDDLHFLFEENAKRIQLVVVNQGGEPIRDASLSLQLPQHESFHIATRLPKIPRGSEFVERAADEQSSYPEVRLNADSIEVSHGMGDIPTESPVNVFRSPLRVCAGSELAGHQVGIRYTLAGENLREPLKGHLRLLL